MSYPIQANANTLTVGNILSTNHSTQLKACKAQIDALIRSGEAKPGNKKAVWEPLGSNTEGEFGAVAFSGTNLEKNGQETIIKNGANICHLRFFASVETRKKLQSPGWSSFYSVSLITDPVQTADGQHYNKSIVFGSTLKDVEEVLAEAISSIKTTRATTVNKSEKLLHEAKKYKTEDQFIKSQGITLYSHSDVEMQNFSNTWLTNNNVSLRKRPGKFIKEVVVDVKNLKKLANAQQATDAGLYHGDNGATMVKNLQSQSYDGVKMMNDGDTLYFIFSEEHISSKEALQQIYRKVYGVSQATTTQKQFALWDKTTGKMFDSLWSNSNFIGHPSKWHRFSAAQWTPYFSQQLATDGRQSLVEEIRKTRDDYIRDHLSKYDTLKSDIPQYIKITDNLIKRYQELAVVQRLEDGNWRKLLG